jgi:hypothetical protein
MTVEVAGSGAIGVQECMRYGAAVGLQEAYRVPGSTRPPVTVRRSPNGITVRETETDVEGSGATYLDALIAFEAARRG